VYGERGSHTDNVQIIELGHLMGREPRNGGRMRIPLSDGSSCAQYDLALRQMVTPMVRLKCIQPMVSNGLPLTKIHHAAFDAQLIGIDPDSRIHVSDRLLEIHDGPFLELGLKGIVGQVIELPRRSEDRPDRDRLAIRFEQFKKAA
jgi:hypothetical protein